MLDKLIFITQHFYFRISQDKEKEINSLPTQTYDPPAFKIENSSSLKELQSYETTKSYKYDPPKIEGENSSFQHKSQSGSIKASKYNPPIIEKENSGNLQQLSNYDSPKLEISSERLNCQSFDSSKLERENSGFLVALIVRRSILEIEKRGLDIIG